MSLIMSIFPIEINKEKLRIEEFLLLKASRNEESCNAYSGTKEKKNEEMSRIGHLVSSLAVTFTIQQINSRNLPNHIVLAL